MFSTVTTVPPRLPLKGTESPIIAERHTTSTTTDFACWDGSPGGGRIGRWLRRGAGTGPVRAGPWRRGRRSVARPGRPARHYTVYVQSAGRRDRRRDRPPPPESGAPTCQ